MRCPSLRQLPPPPPGKTGWPWTEDSAQCSATGPAGKPWPRISVVTPSYNQGQFIEETIRSVLLQGYPDLEYIIIDGGSTDGTLDILRRYEPWLSYWVSEPDRGQTHAINKGWTRATGEILAYINTDDCYLRNVLTIAAHEFCDHPDVGMVYGTAIIVDQAGKELRRWQAAPFDLEIMLTQGNTVPQPAAFFSKGALTAVGHLSEEWEMILDYEFCIRLGTRFPSICLPKTLARFRVHGQSKSWQRFEETTRELFALVDILETERMSSDEWPRIRRMVTSRIHYELALGYAAQEQEEGSKALKELRESVSLYPLFALRRPLLTAHIMRQVLLRYWGQLSRKGMKFMKSMRW